MVKRVLPYDESSNEDSPSSLDGADYREQIWPTTGSANDWRSLSWAFGLGPSSSSAIVGRRRGRRGAAAARKAAGTPRAGEEDTMAELLEIVLWNDEREIDITADLTDEEEDDDSDDEDLAAIKRCMAREETIRPTAAARTAGVMTRAMSGGKKGAVGGKGVEGKKSSSGHLSVSSLRFDSMLKIGSTAVGKEKKQPGMRFEQRTNTMDRAFRGVLDDSYISDAASSSSLKSKASGAAGVTSLSEKSESTATLVAGGEGDEENFWDDVEF